VTNDAYLLVDGYNIINSWSELDRLKSSDLGHARDKLVEVLANYSAFKGCRTTVVFDAYATRQDGSIEEVMGLFVVYTGEGETADSYIEKMAYDLLTKKKKVFVVTGDYVEQTTILGMGAYRMTARELYHDCAQSRKEIIEKVVDGHPLKDRREVADRLGYEVIDKLEKLRRKSQEQ
jgi:Predicted RNA-binding protein containing a PIN domain